MASTTIAETRTAPPAIAERFYRPELDALRFLAFFLVFLHHVLPHSSAEFPTLARPVASVLASLARAAAWGVDLFFALSAYLITSLLIRELQARGTVDVRAFYVRRALRIWPLYFVALLVLAPAIPGGAMPAPYIGAYFLLAGNWACALWGFPASSFASLWSVSIEEQFYLTFPWLVRKTPRYLPHMATAALLLANVTRISLVASGSVHPGIWCNTLTRLDPIALGVLLACVPAARLQFSGALRMLIWYVIAAGFFALGTWGDHTGLRSLFTYPLAAILAVSVVAVANHRTYALPNWLAYLGKISYGLYVFHAAVIHLVNAAGVRQPLFLLPASLALSVMAAGLSYRYLESPFLLLKEPFARVKSRPV